MISSVFGIDLQASRALCKAFRDLSSLYALRSAIALLRELPKSGHFSAIVEEKADEMVLELLTAAAACQQPREVIAACCRCFLEQYGEAELGMRLVDGAIER